MKLLLSEAGQCIVFGVMFLILIYCFGDILHSVTGG